MSRSAAQTSDMLASLRIERERSGKVDATRRPWPLTALLAPAALLGAALAVVAFQERDATDPSPDSATGTPGALAPPRTAEAEPSPGVEASAAVLDATGYVVARRQATVSAKTTGKVSEVLVEEGMHVDRGQVIARLDDSVERAELGLASAQVDAARSMLRELDVEIAHARRTLARTRALARRAMMSRADLDDRSLQLEILLARHDRAQREAVVAERHLAVQRRRLEDLEIRAPFAGVVVDKTAQPGEMVSPISAGGGFTRTGLGTIVDMHSLEVEVDVSEAYIHRVHAAQAASVTLNAYPEHPYRAEVVTVVPAADRTRATVAVRLALLEIDARVLPNMGVRVTFLATRTDESEPNQAKESL